LAPKVVALLLAETWCFFCFLVFCRLFPPAPAANFFFCLVVPSTAPPPHPSAAYGPEQIGVKKRHISLSDHALVKSSKPTDRPKGRVVNVRAMKQSALIWHAIPNELLVHVFTFLSCVDRIRVAQLVCSRWRHVVLYLNNAPHCCLIYAHNPSLVKKYAILCHTLSHTWIDGRNKSIRGHLVGERKCAIDRECVCVCVCVYVFVYQWS